MDIAGTLLSGYYSMSKRKWYILDYDSGSEIFTPKSIIDVAETNDVTVASEIIEQGSFTTYHKTNSPKELNVTIGLAGTNAKIQNALTEIDNYCSQTKKVNVICPIKEYTSFTFAGYDYTLNMNSAVIVNLKLIEVRETQLAYSQVTTTQIASEQADGEGNTISDTESIDSEDATNASDTTTTDTGETSTEKSSEQEESILHKMGL